MSRVQLALNVADVDAAVEYYSRLFGVAPAKRRPGYANFAVVDPPLKLVLIENGEQRGQGVAGALNHLGIEVASPQEVESASVRLADEGLNPSVQENTTCCYAVQDKAWTQDPNGVPWEVYTVLADAPEGSGLAGDSGCRTSDGACVPTSSAGESSTQRSLNVVSACC